MKKIAEKWPRKSVEPGDIWQLGSHRLFCGDCLSVPDELFDSKIRAVITDPPYGVGYVENHSEQNEVIGKITKNKIIAGDHLQSHKEYADFTEKWIVKILDKLDEYNQFYIFNGDLMILALREAMVTAGLHFSQLLIWIKGGGATARKDFVPQHELIAYGWFNKHKFEAKMGTSIIYHTVQHKSRIHPTMKPVGLIRKLIINSTRVGETVYDAFGGSGTTLIAAEQLMRKCIIVELDKGYCSDIIARWEKLTGQTATKI